MAQRSIHTLLSRQSRIWGEVEALSHLGGQGCQGRIQLRSGCMHVWLGWVPGCGACHERPLKQQGSLPNNSRQVAAHQHNWALQSSLGQRRNCFGVAAIAHLCLGGQGCQPLIKALPELGHAIAAKSHEAGQAVLWAGITTAPFPSATCPHAEKVSCLPPWEGWVAGQAAAAAGAAAAAAGRGSPAGRVLTGASCHTRALRGLCYSPAVGHLVSRQSSEFNTATCVLSSVMVAAQPVEHQETAPRAPTPHLVSSTALASPDDANCRLAPHE